MAPRKKAAKKAVKKAAKKAATKAGKKTPAKSAPKKGAKKDPTPDDIFRALPARQQIFIGEYFANKFNATKAAIAAGFSERTADSQACRLLKNDKVSLVVAARKNAALEDLQIDADRVKTAIAKIAFADGSVPGAFASTKERLKGLELLGRHFKLFTDVSETKVRIERVVVREAMKEPRPLPPAEPEF